MNIIQALMNCCGVVGAYGFNAIVVRENGSVDHPGKEDHQRRLTQLIEAQKEQTRSCGIIFLAAHQAEAIKEAEAMNFRKVHSFYNPNSNWTVYVYVHTLWADKAEWKEFVNKRRYAAGEVAEEDDE